MWGAKYPLVARRIMLHGLVGVKMRNQGFTVANLKAKIMFCIWLKPICSVFIHIFKKRRGYKDSNLYKKLSMIIHVYNKLAKTDIRYQKHENHHYYAKLHVAKCGKSYLIPNAFTIIRYRSCSPGLAL